MTAQLKNKEGNTVSFTFTVDKETFEKGLTHSYHKNKTQINLPGFRKGKAPRALIEKQFGEEIFYDDAFNFVLPDAYDNAVKELDLDVVSKPEIDVEEASKETGVLFSCEVTVKPEVTLGDYKGVSYKKEEASASDDDVMAKLKEAQEKNSRLVDITNRAVLDGDTVNINFEGFIDDVPFEGGKGEDYDLVIGSKSFIDTFEEQIVGKNIGDEFDVNVKFPEEYGNSDLNGKPAVFKVKVNSIKLKELPELDDDFASDVSEFDTLDEYKNQIQEKLLEEAKQKIESQKEEDIMKKITENATMDLPEIMVTNQVEQMISDFANRLRMQGLTLEMYAQYTGQDIEGLKTMYKEQAEVSVRSRLVLETIAKEENIAVTIEEVDEQVEKLAASYGIELERMKSVLREQDIVGIESDIKVQKALKFVVDNAVAE